MDKNKTDEYALKEFIKAFPKLLKHKKYKIIIQKSRSLAENTNSSIAYNILGNSLFQIGKVEESITYLEKSLELRQDFFPVYKNLAKAYFRLGKFAAIEKLLKGALERFPFESSLLDQLSTLYLKLKDYKNAIHFLNLSNKVHQTHKKLFALAKANLEITKQENCQTALRMTVTYIHRAFQNMDNDDKSDFYAFAADFYSSIKLFEYSKTDTAILFQLLKTSFWEQSARGIRQNYLNPLLTERFIENLKEDTNFSEKTLIEIAELPLFKEILILAPYPYLQVEKLLKLIRRSILTNRNKIENIKVLTPFLESLAINNFLTEYLFNYDKYEEKELSKIKTFLTDQLANDDSYIFHLLIFLCYQNLEQAELAKILNNLQKLKQIKSIFLDAPQEERRIRKHIKTFGHIENASIIAKHQYEENPYPRWHNHVRKISSKSFNDTLLAQELNPAKFVNFNNSKKSILIAGCGTGLNIFKVANGFPDSKITAIDLSLTSLAYAKRKIQEANIKNISLYHGDILQLKEIRKTFDYVECMGVLHHIKNHLQAWHSLKRCLKKNGVMRVGLYSRHARKDIINFRETLKWDLSETSQDKVLYERQKIIDSGKNYRFTKSSDFFSKSGVRDLILNSYEKQFDLLEIEEILRTLNLDFLGIQVRNKKTRSNFKKLFPKNDDWFALKNWDKLEKEFPDTFFGMYQFWCQKN